MDRVPVNAAVNEGVKLTKKYCARASGFINAVLRKIAVNKASLPKPLRDNTVKYFSTLYSHSEWFVEYLIKRIGEEETEKFLAANNDIPPVHAHANTLKISAEELENMLESSGCEWKAHSWLEGCYELHLGGNIEEMEVFKNGYIQIQDAAARVAVLAAEPKKETKVLDVCAAPGGKSIAAAMLMNNKGSVVSCDIYLQKILEIENAAKRLGIEIITAKQADASEYNEHYAEKFDLVIADVPCSGMGIIRKKPEIRYKTAEEVANMPAIQKRIINNVSRYVKPGGLLLYSTCTVMQSENEDIVNGFLSEHEDFSTEAFNLPCSNDEISSGMITLWPHIHETDGFFICRLRRRG